MHLESTKPRYNSVMNRSAEQQQLPLQIADVLDPIAAEPGRSDNLWTMFDALLKRAAVDGGACTL
jgi:hypothetical protein